VHLGTDSVFDEPVAGTVDLTLPMDEPGWLLIAFNNDLNDPPADRNLVIRDLRLDPATGQDAR